jgi:hypothetical protein
MYCYVYDWYADNPDHRGPRYSVNMGDDVLAEFSSYDVATWFKDTVTGAYTVAMTLDQGLRKALTKE